ncbi:MAG: ATP-binding protein, partial [Clostridia bacterium]|nr:ATP-binding protein [Clostridia bacterium]
MNENSLDVRRQHELEEALLEADNIIMKKYMNNISKFEIKEIDSEIKDVDLNNVFRVNCVEKLVFNTDENNLEKLMNVYNAVGMCGGDIVNIIISDGKNIEYYIGTRTKDLNNIATCQDTLVSAFNGNFPGSVVKAKKKGAMNECIEKVFGSDNNRVVSVVSGIPGYRDEKNKENKKFVQGIERIIDSMSGKAFALVTISSPLSATQITQIKDGYETLYTRISPFATSQLSYNESESNAVAESITDGITETIGDSLTTTLSNSTSNSVGTNTTKSFNGSLILVGESVSNGTNHNYTSQESESSAEAHNSSKSDSHSIGKTDTYTNTNGRALQINIENKSVKNLMDKIDKILLRIEDSADLGLWNTATYCIADDSHTSRVLASAIEALCRGDKNSIENFALDTWTDSTKNEKVKEYLRKMIHPVLLVGGNTGVFEVNPSSLINGKELVIEAGIPQKSVPGLPVSEMIPFSRNVVNELFSGESKLVLGQINHMGQTESTTVELDIESLSAHTLITGSTGSGKSNTVYHILSELKKNDIKFLVVEPAKGEYKNVFGNDNDVKVYSTNENFSELLKINPFKFPKSVHVLEHIDRLIEIFNVCWPMYAAMPAVLKDAVLSAYESCGWDLEESLNSNGNRYYPNFKDLQRELINVIDKTAYSDEIKGNYIGSLATRVKSLTNGINGKIFTNSDLEYSELFDENVIVDLSRVGSCETKSLIMGLLVMSLNEYRMEQSLTEMNQNLRHITVLEEAHNLLRNTSMGGNSEEGGNLAGKSVEMITNSIAEMRTYGEGFIIVDQSPNAIDISAIRNTNTKIIMRLPEESDRKQAGKSAALRDNQIDELAKLKRGIAVVYQNNWLDPVLCAINKADVEIKPYSNSYSREVKRINCSGLLKLFMKNRVDEKIDVDI